MHLTHETDASINHINISLAVLLLSAGRSEQPHFVHKLLGTANKMGLQRQSLMAAKPRASHAVASALSCSRRLSTIWKKPLRNQPEKRTTAPQPLRPTGKRTDNFTQNLKTPMALTGKYASHMLDICYTNDAASVEAFCDTWLAKETRLHLGFDLEHRPTYIPGSRPNVALLQYAWLTPNYITDKQIRSSNTRKRYCPSSTSLFLVSCECRLTSNPS